MSAPGLPIQLTAVVAGAIALVTLSACGEKSEPGPVPTLKIGVAFSLTGSGAAYGKPALAGAQVAAQNETSAKVELVVRDDHSDPAAARKAVNQLVAADVDAILAPTLSPNAQAAGSIAKKAGIPYLGVTTTTADFTPLDPVAYRVALTEEALAPTALEAAKKIDMNSAVLVSEPGDGYSRSAEPVYTAAAEKLGIKLQAKLEVTDDNVLREVGDAARGNTDGLILVLRSDTAAKALDAARSTNADVVLVGSNGFNSADVVEAAGDAASGLITASPWNPLLGDRTSRDFVHQYERKQEGTTPDAQSALGSGSVEVVATAADESGPSPRQILQWLGSSKTSDSVLGDIKFNESHDAVYKAVPQHVDNGKFVPVT